MHEFATAFGISFAAMFPMLNPIGHAPMFYALTQDDSAGYRHRQALKSSLYAVLILVIALLAGEYILTFFGITLNDLRIAGGVLVARTAWAMLGNDSRVTAREHEAAQDKDDISLTPMATPILSGPGAMSLAVGLVSYGNTPLAYGGYLAGFVALGLLTWVCLRWSDVVVRSISVNAIGAMNRILGFLILAIGVDLVVRGVRGALLPAS
ncbi:MAG: NAAT family transporter [bacterium]|nr:NAAT family transporter [bacterium]